MTSSGRKIMTSLKLSFSMFSTSFQRFGITFFQRLKDVICPLGKLTSKLATLVFSIEELAQSRGQGFGEAKKGDIRTVVKHSTKIECLKGKDFFSLFVDVVI